MSVANHLGFLLSKIPYLLYGRQYDFHLENKRLRLIRSRFAFEWCQHVSTKCLSSMFESWILLYGISKLETEILKILINTLL